MMYQFHKLEYWHIVNISSDNCFLILEKRAVSMKLQS